MNSKKRKDIINELDSNFEEYKKNLSDEEITLLSEYTDENWASYASCFYKLAAKKHPQYGENLKRCIDDIEKYKNKIKRKYISQIKGKTIIQNIASSRLPCELVLYRGINRLILENSCIITKKIDHKTMLYIGDKIVNLVPWSTSIDYEAVSNFVLSGFLEIHIPCNFPGIWLEPITLVKEEYEILLPPELTFEVIDTKFNEYSWLGPNIEYHILKPIR